MSEGVLTAERILLAAEDVLRRYGPAKATVVDVARALGVSHGSVYRHFPSKTALSEAVLRRWLSRAMPPLLEVVEEEGAAEPRLRRWVRLLVAQKHRRALEDPELFATYVALAARAVQVIDEHRSALTQHLVTIIEDGVRDGDFRVDEPAISARALFDATTRFHHPSHLSEWSRSDIAEALEAVLDLTMSGLKARGHEPSREP